jgi:hypothetical protein
MSSLLKVRYAHPLEREFEAWIVEGIEHYGERVGLPLQVWAISPAVEVSWPADEKVVIDGKVIGLQFKQARLGAGAVDFSRLKWSLSTPAGQYASVQNSPEVYYCLPTFVNRDFRREALQHCLFWRPPQHVTDTQAWYDNPVAATAHRSLALDPTAMRWGRLMEQVQACTVGRRVSSRLEVDAYLADVRRTMGHVSHLEETGDTHEEPVAPMYLLYILYIPLN